MAGVLPDAPPAPNEPRPSQLRSFYSPKQLRRPRRWCASLRRCRRTGLALLAGCLALVAAAHAYPASPAPEYEVKAAFLYNFAKFIQWPAEKTAGTTLRLCLLRDDPFGPSMDAVRGKTVGDKTLEVSLITAPADAAGCQILFIPRSQAGDLERVLATLKGGAVLTVGDTDGFAERGVIVNFYIENQKVRFEINIDAARRSGLTISSQLLKLARIARDGEKTYE